VVFDSGSASDAHALARLQSDMIGWLTTVTPEGQPQTMPLWFLWDGASALIYSDRRAKRNGNIRANPRVTLHLNDDGRGGDVVVLEGEARIDDETPALPDNPAYVAKYRAWILDGFNTPEEMATIYNVPVRIVPTRGRAF
jgi:PPOX class probable F420-dependent enzyme